MNNKQMAILILREIQKSKTHLQKRITELLEIFVEDADIPTEGTYSDYMIPFIKSQKYCKWADLKKHCAAHGILLNSKQYRAILYQLGYDIVQASGNHNYVKKIMR